MSQYEFISDDSNSFLNTTVKTCLAVTREMTWTILFSSSIRLDAIIVVCTYFYSAFASLSKGHIQSLLVISSLTSADVEEQKPCMKISPSPDNLSLQSTAVSSPGLMQNTSKIFYYVFRLTTQRAEPYIYLKGLWEKELHPWFTDRVGMNLPFLHVCHPRSWESTFMSLCCHFHSLRVQQLFRYYALPSVPIW